MCTVCRGSHTHLMRGMTMHVRMVQNDWALQSTNIKRCCLVPGLAYRRWHLVSRDISWNFLNERQQLCQAMALASREQKDAKIIGGKRFSKPCRCGFLLYHIF